MNATIQHPEGTRPEVEEASEIVRFENVTLCFDEVCALDRVSFRMNAGETRIVFGAAGSGKTMLLKTTVGLVCPDSGNIFLFGQDIKRSRRLSSMIFAAASVFCFRKADCSTR